MASQEDVYDEAKWIVEHTLEGHKSTIFCYGITGAGKSYTMVGPATSQQETARREPGSEGLAQRVSHLLFDGIRERSSRGEVHSIEASFVQIHTSKDGNSKEVLDLLADGDIKPLRPTKDPLDPDTYTCFGLKKLQMGSAEQLVEVLEKGERRRAHLETAKGLPTAVSHCIFMVTVECLVLDGADSFEPTVKRGKLMVVDLAGSESLETDALSEQQAIGIQSVLSTIGGLVAPMGRTSASRDLPQDLEVIERSAVTMLLRDCFGGGGRIAFIANIVPEASDFDETMKTLSFSQPLLAVKSFPALQVKGLASASTSPKGAMADTFRPPSVRGLSGLTSPTNAKVEAFSRQPSVRGEGEGSLTLQQMQQRHADCLERLKTNAKDPRAEGQRQRMQSEVADLSSKLQSKESSNELKIQALHQEQSERMSQMRREMTEAMGSELERLRMESLENVDVLRNSVERHVSLMEDYHQQSQFEEKELQAARFLAEVEDARIAQKATAEEASSLRVKVAAASERANLLQSHLEELRKERSDYEEERKALKQQSEDQWQRLNSAEGDLQRLKREADAQQAEIERLKQKRIQEEEDLRAEKEAWRRKEADLMEQIAQQQRSLDDTKRESEVRLLRAENDQKDEMAQLRMQIQRLEVEAATRAEQLQFTRQMQSQLEAERDEAKQREEELRHHDSFQLRELRRELEEARHREEEMTTMYHEMTEGLVEIASSRAKQGQAV